MERISKALVGASAHLIILLVLKQGKSYGYEIIQKVKELTNGQVQWHEIGVYPVLKKLEQEGMIKSSWSIVEGERPRKYYSIQDKGLKQVEIDKHEWELVEDLFRKLIRPE
jgi:PadR family transcriptional regulator, regulatory protein PadR